MAAVMDVLRQEHRNIAQLLDAFERQIETVAGAADADYEVLRGIAEYFCDYPDRCHHPKENAVFEHLRNQDPEAAARVGDLAHEHRDCGARARRFRDNITALFHEAVLPRTTLVNAARSFIEAERDHMRMEEELFFPLAEQKLAAADWDGIAGRLQSERDPLFENRDEERFRVLRERLLASEPG